MIKQFVQHQNDRLKQGIPACVLSAKQTGDLIELLSVDNPQDSELLLDLFKNQIPAGVDEAAKIKVEFLEKIAKGQIKNSLIDEKQAVEILGTMLGGFNVEVLIDLLDDEILAPFAGKQLAKIILVYDGFDRVLEKSKNNKYAKQVIQDWVAARWFADNPPLSAKITLVVYKVDGEINTDDISPASQAFSRPDIPLHSLSMLQSRDKNALQKIADLKQQNLPVVFVGDVVGTGSSRKSALNSLLWHIGDDIPFIPNKKRGGVILGGKIAPIFFNTAEDAGSLPIECDVSGFKTYDIIHIYPYEGKITDDKNNTITTFKLQPATLLDEIQALGRMNLIIGRSLSQKAATALNIKPNDIFIQPSQPENKDNQYTLAQKIIGKACSKDGVKPGEYVEPIMTTVASQDTTGPMTVDELKDLACLKFQADFVMQSFCHTAAYPKKIDIQTHKNLPPFFQNRGGVALKPKDGVVHSWLNRMIIPDTVGTGGDSHTRFPLGISFPAGSGMIAFAATLGKMPLDMPESVKVKFTGKMQEAITLRDMVNSLAKTAIDDGKLTIDKAGKKNIYSGKIIEIEGLSDLKVEQAFELSDSSAERSAAACTIALDKKPVIEYLKSNVVLLKNMITQGYEDKNTIQKRINDMQNWLKNPALLKADKDAIYHDTITIDMNKITEPLVACPNDPDDVKTLSAVAGTKIDEVFVGSCMTNIGHFRACAKILEHMGQTKAKLWITPPTKMDEKQLTNEGIYNTFATAGARIEIPGCSLCMGNQARATTGSTIFSTSTRNFPNRLGTDTQTYLGSAELATICSCLGKIPTKNEYLKIMQEAIKPNKNEIYRYLNFDKMDDYNNIS
ncbi:MAG: bifunctional aconitate hydratase 2/2-methylisocitrate dehydratase [Gammaproteobacteria bacterium]|nr:MAG: bifunctional aconitate hydratase 2/2-methylisocitrate dehydratase [Gammaproteobacteria bacterium]